MQRRNFISSGGIVLAAASPLAWADDDKKKRPKSRSDDDAEHSGGSGSNPPPTPTPAPGAKSRVIVIGGGMAGATVAKYLRLWGDGIAVTNFANVQPNSGSQMNQAVFLALLQPGDTFMGLDLNSGGHLTHGSPVNMSGKWFNGRPYGVRRDDHLLDMDEVARIAREHKPKLIIAGGTAYSRIWDWALPRDRR
jgi:hypothetical protein